MLSMTVVAALSALIHTTLNPFLTYDQRLNSKATNNSPVKCVLAGKNQGVHLYQKEKSRSLSSQRVGCMKRLDLSTMLEGLFCMEDNL